MTGENRELSEQERAGKAFPVSWDQFHRDCRALTWRLNEVGPFHAVIAITRGGLVLVKPALSVMSSNFQLPLLIYNLLCCWLAVKKISGFPSLFTSPTATPPPL